MLTTKPTLVASVAGARNASEVDELEEGVLVDPRSVSMASIVFVVGIEGEVDRLVRLGFSS